MTSLTKKLFIVLSSMAIFYACNKTKSNSNKLGGYKWEVKSLTVNGSELANKPTLLFKDCDIYKESCEGSWISVDQGRAAFAWQFSENGKTLEIANQTDHVHGIADVKAAEQCIEFTGVYNVQESKRKTLVIKTDMATGYKNKSVEIKLERID